MRKSLSLFVLCLFASVVSFGQTFSGYIYDAGSPAYSVNFPVENGYINVANGNLHLEFPISNARQRGALQVNERLVYDSHWWKVGHYSNYYWWPDNLPRDQHLAAGWRFVNGAATGTLQASTGYSSSYPCDDSGNYTQVASYNYTWQDPQGTAHVFDGAFNQQYSGCDSSPGYSQTIDTPANDSSGLVLTASGDSSSGPDTIVVRDSSGAQLYPTIADRYGNYWSVDANGDLIDDRGQTPVQTTYDDANHKIYFDVLRPGGTRARYTITTVQVSPHTFFRDGRVAEYPNGSNAQLLNAVQAIQLPDGSQYSFEYDPAYAMMTKLTLPTGGVIQYGWTTFIDSYTNRNRWLTSRQVGSNPPFTFTPSVVTNCGSNQTDCHEKVTVTDPSSNDTVYDQRLNNGAWNTTFYKYSGSAASGTLVTTNETDFDFSTSCGYSCGNQGAKWIVSSSNTTTLNDVGVKWTKKLEYADRTSGLVSSEKTFDFYTGTVPSQPAVETDYEYSPIIPRDVLTTTTKDGAGNILSKESRTFSAATSQTSAPTGHTTPLNQYVYLTSVGQWLDAGGTQIATSFQMDDAGTVTAVSTPYNSSSSSPGTPNAWKTYSYDATDSFPTSSKEPATPSNVDLISGSTVDASTGVTTATTDYNNQPTTYSNFDWLGRPGQISSPDSGSSTLTYYASGVTTVSAVDSGRTRTTVQEIDEFGRPSRTALSNGQATNIWYQQDVCYDANGRVSSASLTYSGPGFGQAKRCSDISYTYDALGRPLTSTNADGTVEYKYKGRATSVKDVNGRTRITQIDALGRTAYVCEVASESYPVESPQDCGLDIAGTGYLTTYTYDLANHKTIIQQGLQQRITQTDWLGRTIYTHEPERGDTSYAYSYGTNGLTVTRTRPQANQSDPNALVDRITAMDNLGRTLSVTYATHPGSPATSSMQDVTTSGTKQFAYDKSDVQWFGGDNAKGRMTVANVMAGYIWATSYKYNYDAMGRVANRFTCLAAWCNSLTTRSMTRSYSYDYAGDKTLEVWNYGYNAANQFPTVGMTYRYTIAGELDQMLGGLNDGAMPLFPYHYKAANHTAQGTQSEQYGNGLYGTRIYDALGRTQGKWICVGTTSFGCNAGDGVNRHVEGYLRFNSGDRVTRLINVMGDNTYSYDNLGRLSASTPTGSSTPQLTWTYDRYGNRLSQHDVQHLGFPFVDLWYDQSSNHIVGYNQPNTPGVSYDAAGNMTGDGRHTYLYDQEGNLRCVDSCSKGSNLYDAFDRRVFHHMHQYSDRVERYEYNEDGQISDVWCNENQYECQSRYYANGENFGYWLAGPAADLSQQAMHFQHNDYLGTVHARTYGYGAVNGDPMSAREGTYYSLPWGDGKSYAAGNGSSGGTDDSNAHYAELEHDQFDIYSDADQALNRTYVAAQGSWLQPDPYDGSYDSNNPQSFNRYAYVNNNPLMLSDPSGRLCGYGLGEAAAVAGQVYIEGAACAVNAIVSIFKLAGLFSKPHCDACMTPRPGQVWTEHGDFYVPKTNLGSVSGILTAAGVGNVGCGFAGCAPSLSGGFQTGADVLKAAPAFPSLVAACAALEPCPVIALGIAAVSVVGLDIYQMSRADDRSVPPCDPPAGTSCYSEHDSSTRTHNGWDLHYHLYLRNQNPVTGQCYWNKQNGTQGTLGVAPPGVLPCSTYGFNPTR